MSEPINSAAAPPAAAPVAAPAATSTPAVTTPVSTSPAAATTPVTSDTSTPLDSEQTVAAMVAAAENKGFGSEEKKPAEIETPAVVEPTLIEEKTPEQKAADEAAAAADKGAGQDDDESYTLDEDGFVGAKDLAAKIEANAALKSALPEDVRNEIMANARLAEFGASMREHFASPEEAKIISESAQEYAGMIEAFQGVSADVQKGTTSLVQKILEMSALRNADGTPMKNEQGEYLTDGTAGKFFDTIFERKFAVAISQKVKALGNENVQAALDLVMESVGLRPSTAAQDPISDPALASRKAELDAQEARIKADRAESTKATWKAYDEAVGGDLSSLYDSTVAKVLDSATALDAFTRGAVEKELESATKAAIKGNTAYQMERKRIEAMPPTPERRQAENALAKRFLRSPNFIRAIKPVLDKAGIVVGKKVEERAAAQAARTENVRSEINGGAPTPIKPAGSQDASQQREAIAASLKTQLGRDPSESDITVALMLAAAKAKGFAA